MHIAQVQNRAAKDADKRHQEEEAHTDDGRELGGMILVGVKSGGQGEGGTKGGGPKGNGVREQPHHGVMLTSLHKMQANDGVQSKASGAHPRGVVKGVGHSGTIMLMGTIKFGGKGGVQRLQPKIGKIPGNHNRE